MATQTITPAQVVIAREMLERDLSQLIFDAARKLRWLVARYPTFRPTHTTPGFPDLVLVRNGRLIFAELKREGKDPTDDQEDWLFALRGTAAEVYTWRPRDWMDGTIEALLR